MNALQDSNDSKIKKIRIGAVSTVTAPFFIFPSQQGQEGWVETSFTEMWRMLFVFFTESDSIESALKFNVEMI